MARPRDNGGIDLTLFKAMGHPIRIEILGALSGSGVVLSPSEFSAQTRQRVQRVGYHFKVLAGAGLIELVRQENVRGAVKHFYRAAPHARFTNSAAWAALPGSPAKTAVAAGVLISYFEAAGKAIDAGAFQRRDDARFSWDRITLDDEGLTELLRMVADFSDRMLALEQKCAPRIEQGNAPVEAIYAVGGFESPSAET